MLSHPFLNAHYKSMCNYWTFLQNSFSTNRKIEIDWSLLNLCRCQFLFFFSYYFLFFKRHEHNMHKMFHNVLSLNFFAQWRMFKLFSIFLVYLLYWTVKFFISKLCMKGDPLCRILGSATVCDHLCRIKGVCNNIYWLFAIICWFVQNVLYCLWETIY